MWLLHTTKLKVEEFHGSDIPKYAILSHRWLPQKDEVKFTDITQGRASRRKGFAKLQSCCRKAHRRGYRYVWIDTCCIDKRSSAVLIESINSMYQWYERADECLVYLNDVSCTNLESDSSREKFSRSTWFTRGWTLQELITPRNVRFYNAKWKYIGAKEDLCELLAKITRIDESVLRGIRKLSECPIAQIMSWAATRTTTRVEDRAYSLLGIFGVYLPLLYGQGENAFIQLQEKIIQRRNDHTLFAWNGLSAETILAPSPSCFHGLEDMVCVRPTNDATPGYMMGNQGLSIHLMLIPWSMNTYVAPLNAGYHKQLDQDARRRGVRPYQRTCIYLRRTGHEDKFIRISFQGKDSVQFDGDEIAMMRDRFDLRERQIFIRHTLDRIDHITSPTEPFYGFHLTFINTRMFNGMTPRSSDVLCYHKWDTQQPVFEIEPGQRHMAGILRLSGFPGLYLYLGFNLDFSPVCLITSQGPQERDFDNLSVRNTLGVLDLKWMLDTVRICKDSPDTILAYVGDNSTTTQINCKRLALTIFFMFTYSENLRCQAWHIVFCDALDPLWDDPIPIARNELGTQILKRMNLTRTADPR